MFTIEHDFDKSVVTLVDEQVDATGQPLREDVVIHVFADRFEVTQHDPKSGQVHRIVLSNGQLGDFGAAINLPEGMYTRNG